MSLEIVPARSAEEIKTVADLFQIYTASLGIDLAYQDYATELAGLPGKYRPPMGELLLAYTKDRAKAVGCAALRPLLLADSTQAQSTDLPKICEMKRLYVSPDARGMGLGRILAKRLIEKAINIGYEEMRLDTLSSMVRARELYEKLGFVEIDAYYPTPIRETKFLSLDLKKYDEKRELE